MRISAAVAVWMCAAFALLFAVLSWLIKAGKLGSPE
jgi:hypothetical protein